MSAGPQIAFRFDAGQLRPPVRTSQGFLRVDGYVGRAGIYEYVNTDEDAKQGYGAAGTIRRELRPEEEVFREDSLAAFEGISLTAGHPKTPISITNARAYEVGSVTSAARRDGDRVMASMIIKDPATIKRVEKGELNELSPGYRAEIHKTPGADKRYATKSNPNGEWHVVQRNIQPNHQALVTHARGGGDLRVRMDGVDDVAIERRSDGYGAKLTNAVDGHQHLFDPSDGGFGRGDGQSGTTSWAVSEGAENGHSHAWIRNADGSISIAAAEGHTHTLLDAAVFAAPIPPAPLPREDAMTLEEQVRALKAQLVDAEKKLGDQAIVLSTAQTRADSADAKLKTSEERIVELEQKLAAGASAIETEAVAAQATRADAAEKELAELKKNRETDIRNAAEVRVKAITVMGPEFRVDGMTERAIQSTVIKKFAPKEDTGDAVSNAYIAQRFDSLVDAHGKNARSLTRISDAVKNGPVLQQTRNDSLETREGRADAWRNQASTGGYQAAKSRQKDA